MELDIWTWVALFLAFVFGYKFQDLMDVLFSTKTKSPEQYDTEMEERHKDWKYDPLLKGTKKEGKDD